MKNPIEIENSASITDTPLVENSMILDSTIEGNLSENSENLESQTTENSQLINNKKRTNKDLEEDSSVSSQDISNNNSKVKRQKDNKSDPSFIEIIGVPRISFIVLNANSTVNSAGIIRGNTDNSNSFLLKQKDAYTGPNAFQYAYVVFKGRDKNNKPIQIIFIQGIKKDGNSHHPGVRDNARHPRVKELLKEKLDITYDNDCDYSGECRPNVASENAELTIDNMRNTLGESLTKLTFNLKGTKTTSTYRSEKAPKLITHIPKECFEVSDEHDTAKGLKFGPPDSLEEVDGLDGEALKEQSQSTSTTSEGSKEEEDKYDLARELKLLTPEPVREVNGEVLKEQSQSASITGSEGSNIDVLNKEEIDPTKNLSITSGSHTSANKLSTGSAASMFGFFGGGLNKTASNTNENTSVAEYK
ncbi:hypothetical protein ACQUW5_00915 [Legionella sp. CNM-1927-20]|uniref:hypothetical protein n=1 Tax=Legionella sp. CNM-1927-20 TaxID=3422221 RepID=UPI00403ADC65